MACLEEYAVSDQAGEYVLFTDDYSEAQKVRNYIDRGLAEEGIEGSAAIMRRVERTDDYRFVFERGGEWL